MINIKTINKAPFVQITTSVSFYQNINEYITQPLKAGIIGFATILMIIIITNLFCLAIGVSKNLELDYLDVLLAGAGFTLQVAGSFLKNFIS